MKQNDLITKITDLNCDLVTFNHNEGTIKFKEVIDRLTEILKLLQAEDNEEAKYKMWNHLNSLMTNINMYLKKKFDINITSESSNNDIDLKLNRALDKSIILKGLTLPIITAIFILLMQGVINIIDIFNINALGAYTISMLGLTSLAFTTPFIFYSLNKDTILDKIDSKSINDFKRLYKQLKTNIYALETSLEINKEEQKTKTSTRFTPLKVINRVSDKITQIVLSLKNRGIKNGK